MRRVTLWVLVSLISLCAGFATAVEADGVTQSASLREVVDHVMGEWPVHNRDRVYEALSQHQTTGKGAAGFSIQALEQYLKSVVDAHGSPPVFTSQGAAVVVESIKAVRETPDRSPAEEALYQAQFNEAIATAGTWLEKHREWFPAGVAERGGERFSTALKASRDNPLSLGFQVLLPETVHGQVMALWREELDELDRLGQVAFRSHFEISLIDEAHTPAWEWQQNENSASTVIETILRRYLDIRHEAAVQNLPLYGAVKAARGQFMLAQAEAARNEDVLFRASGSADHELLLDYEVLMMVATAISDGAPFSLYPGEMDTFRLSPSSVSTRTALRQNFTLEYTKTRLGTSGDGPGTPNTLQGLLLAASDCRRFEFLTQTPNQKLGGLLNGPIAWTLVKEQEIMTLFPGQNAIYQGLIRIAPREPEAPDIVNPFQDWGLKNQLPWTLVNFSNMAGGEIGATERDDGGLRVQVTWSRHQPWLYQSRIQRAEYVLKQQGDAYVADHAQLFEGESDAIAATVYWRNARQTPEGAWFYGETEIALHPAALSTLWTTDAPPVGKETRAPKRSVFFRYTSDEAGGTSHVVPASFEVTGPENKRLIYMAFEAPSATLLAEATLRDPVSTLPLERPSPAMEFYQGMKDYCVFRRIPEEERADKWPELLHRFEKVRDRALAEEDWERVRGAQDQVAMILLGARQISQWKTAVRRSLEFMEPVTDREELWQYDACMLQYAYSTRDVEFSTEMEEQYRQLISGRFTTREAMGRGLDYRYVYALPCFSAVRSKSIDRNFLIPAGIGRAEALAEMATYLRRDCQWEIADCGAYLLRAQKELEAVAVQLNASDPPAWTEQIERARKSAAESKAFLEVTTR